MKHVSGSYRESQRMDSMIYRVWVCLENEYDDIEADSEEEAFEIASDAAMSGGSWRWSVEPVGNEDE